MDPERWRRIESLYHAAMERPEAERTAFLAGACPDTELRSQVMALLRSGESSRWIAGAIEPVLEQVSEAEPSAGATIDRYTLIEPIGAGGMGSVWLAERSDGHFRQRVAVKVIRGGLHSEGVLERFRRERQVLASLRHPNIAALLDGGTTDDGLPYLAMEHVDGVPIDRYCDDRRLTVEERLRLFRKVCAAVLYAHRNLVVHRDLKPGNILVTAAGEPKLLDFGIAKLLGEADGEAASELTLTSMRILTPRWASPEQVRGERITTGSDVYQLGLVLYQLLVGRPPYGHPQADPFTLGRIVCDEDPVRPSSAVSPPHGAPPSAGRPTAQEVATLRGLDPRRLRRRLTGDLDAIVLMALRKRPEQRYESVAELSADVRRHLESTPVVARPAGLRYRARKLIRRRRAAFAAGLTVLVVLVGAAAFSTAAAIRAERQRAAAEQQARIVRAVNEFLTADILEQADPYQQADRELSLREAVDRAAGTVSERFAGQPVVEAAIRMTLAYTYEGLGELDLAAEHFEQASELRRAALGEEHRDTLAALNNVAGIRYLQDDRLPEAEAMLERLVAIERRVLGEGDEITLNAMNELANVYDAQGKRDEAEQAYRALLAAQERSLPAADPNRLITANNLALTLAEQQRYDEAEPLLRQVLAVRRESLGPDHPDTILSLGSVGYLYSRSGRVDEAETMLSEAIASGRRVLGADHPDRNTLQDVLAELYRAQGRYAEAERLHRAVVESRRRSLGRDHRHTLRSSHRLALAVRSLGRDGEAEELLREIAGRRGASPGAAGVRWLAVADLAAGYLDQGRDQEAEELLGEHVAEGRRVLAGDDLRLARLLLVHGRCLTAVGRHAEAEADLLAARSILSAALGSGHERTVEVERAMVALYEAWERPDQADAWRSRLAGAGPS